MGRIMLSQTVYVSAETIDSDDIVIKLDAEALGLALSNLVLIGSSPHLLMKAQMVVYMPESMHVDDPQVTFRFLFDHGTDIITALTFLVDNNRGSFTRHEPVDRPENYTQKVIGEAVFVSYFYLLTQNKTPLEVGNGYQAKLFENTLRRSLSNEEADKLMFREGLSYIDPSWIKYVKYDSLSSIARNRLALGTAGYRWISVFRLVEPKAGAPEDIIGYF